jgi:hypothetical protein
LPSLTLDSPAYGLPSKVTVQLGDADLAGAGTIIANAWSTTQTAPITFTLTETGRRGLFSGTFDVIAATNSAVSGKVRAQNGDTLQVQYVNSTIGLTLTATAQIDTSPPQILDVVSDPDYQQAAIYWDTSEATDALVQFGESPGFLNRSAYDGTPGTFHAVTLSGLIPNKVYYFQVVSRDVAGNTALDNNHGTLYNFKTLLPLLPPWSDNMDKGIGDWSVYTPPDSQVEWTLGVPDNGAVTEAHSPPNAWGSNLNGDSIDTAESFLISPAVFLTNGTSATLTFWHWYDFTDPNGNDIINFGEVDILTNNSATTIPLAQYSDASGDWIEEQIDLTPFLGQIVYIAWHYVLFSIDTGPRPGWLVDDVSITVSTTQKGTVRITNNLAQTTYVLSGPLSLQGKGLGTVITNAAPGQYILEFADVPYYLTPTPQTNTLPPGGTILLQGNYKFPDANTNGISDLWETNYFGTVSPTRTQLTDTDGDGMTDYAEFIAGTNPNDSQSNLRITDQVQTGSTVRLEWTSTPGRAYCVFGSADGITWSAISAWLQATSTSMSYTLPLSSPGGPYLYRIEVRP